VSVRSTPNPMPIGQRYGSTDLLLPFESRHYSPLSNIKLQHYVTSKKRYVSVLQLLFGITHLEMHMFRRDCIMPSTLIDHYALERRRRTLVSVKGTGVNRVFLRRTFLPTPKGNGVRCRTTSPFARSRHFISDHSAFNIEHNVRDICIQSSNQTNMHFR
jgi:hypothetical protein